MAADNAEKELMIHSYCRQGDRERVRWGDVRVNKAEGD